jgi:hypothetical protein
MRSTHTCHCGNLRPKALVNTSPNALNGERSRQCLLLVPGVLIGPPAFSPRANERGRADLHPLATKPIVSITQGTGREMPGAKRVG